MFGQLRHAGLGGEQQFVPLVLWARVLARRGFEVRAGKLLVSSGAGGSLQMIQQERPWNLRHLPDAGTDSGTNSGPNICGDSLFSFSASQEFGMVGWTRHLEGLISSRGQDRQGQLATG